MKKNTLLLVLFLTTLWSYSQVRRYTFDHSNGSNPAGSYSEISNGTVLNLGTGGQFFYVGTNASVTDPANGSTAGKGSGLDIGFNFRYNGFVYDKFGIHTNGWIGLGSSSFSSTLGANNLVDLSVSNVSTPLSGFPSTITEELCARIAALTRRLKPSTNNPELSYKVITDPTDGRILVIQWKNFADNSASSASDVLNFQIRLYENTGMIKIVYGNIVNSQTSALSFQVGLKGNSTNTTEFASNYNNIQSTSQWINVTNPGLSVTATITMTNLNYPVSGLTYTWTPNSCMEAKSFSVNSLTYNTVNLSWASYSPAPDGGFEYLVKPANATTDSAGMYMPLPSDYGTPISAASPSITLNNRVPNTLYFVYVRSKCGSNYTSWYNLGSFTTPCPAVTGFWEDFESTPANLLAVPVCWGTFGSTSTASVKTGIAIGNNGSTPNGVSYSLTASATAKISYLHLPETSNLQAGTGRLRFKAYASGSKLVELGYFSNYSDSNTFVPIGSATVTSTDPVAMPWVTINPTASIPDGIGHLVLKVVGPTVAPNFTMMIDDVVWEPKPINCGDLSNITFSNITTSAVNLSFTSSSSETTWDYGYTPATVLKPDTVTVAGQKTSTSFTIDGLAPGTSYTIWLRSNCGANKGSWYSIGVVTTLCERVPQTYDTFDNSTFIPGCWRKLGTAGILLLTSGKGTAGTNALELKTADNTNPVIVSLPPFSNMLTGDARMRFKMSSPSAKTNVSLSIGYVTDLTNPASYQELTTAPIAVSSAVTEVSKPLGALTISPNAYLAFKFINSQESTGTSLYIDDFSWEIKPASGCSDFPIPSAPSIKEIKSNSVKLSWTSGGSESEWEYIVGLAADDSPINLPVKTFDPLTTTIVNVNTITGIVTGMNPSSSYKVWARPSCSSSSKGSWFGPVYFTTTCAPVDSFTENFNASANFPNCWNKITGTASVAAITSPGTNYLTMTARSTVPTIMALPPVTNANSGTNLLRFSLSGDTAGESVEVGYLTNISDPTSFRSMSPALSYPVSSTTTFANLSADLGLNPTSQVLAFKYATTSTTNKVLYIDDVQWVSKPTCPDLKNLKITNITDNSVMLSWYKGGTESGWDYAISSPTVTDTTTLTAYPFSSPVVGQDTGTGDIPVSAVVSGLTADTGYKVWVRPNCGGSSLTSNWLPIPFSTTCSQTSAFNQDFDTTQKGNTLPSCWKKITGISAVDTTTGSAGSTNVLTLGSSISKPLTIVAMPPVNNAPSNTYRLRFKLKASTTVKSVKVGYLTNITDYNSFQLNEVFTAGTAAFETKISYFPSTLTSPVLAFEDEGLFNGIIYIDEVVWEPIPSCLEVKLPVVSTVSSSSAAVNWTAGSSESAWQYVVGTASDMTPDALTIKDIISPVVVNGNVSALITGLTPSTPSKLWLRASCGSSVSRWSDPIEFTTLCPTVSSIPKQTFESSINNQLPPCWINAGKTNLMSITASGPNNVLKLQSTSDTNFGAVALPAVSNAAAGTHRLKLDMMGVVNQGDENASIEIGYYSNPSTFVTLAYAAAGSTTEFVTKFIELGTGFTTEEIVIKKSAQPTGTVYIDNVVWEPSAECTDVVKAAVKLTSGAGVQLSWSQTGTEADWQYITGPSSVTDPNTLPSASIVGTKEKSLTIENLNPDTSYKVWVRSNCGNSHFGNWSDPVSFIMPCTAANTITENFDSGSDIPNCWRKAGSLGTVSVTASPWMNSNNALALTSNGSGLNNSVYTSIPPLASAMTGGCKMKFVYQSSQANTVMYLVNFNDPLNVNPDLSYPVLKTFTMPAANTQYTFEDVLPTAETPYLGFIVYNDSGISTVYIDDFGIKQLLPSCAANITAAPGQCGDSATQITWDSAQYASGYKLTIGTTAGGSDIMNNQDLGNVQSYSFTGSADKTYYYTLTAYNASGNATDCTEQSFKTNTKTCLGVDLFESNNLSFYPNPVINTLNIIMNQDISGIEIMNLLGQKVTNLTNSTNQIKVDMSSLTNGMYLIKVISGDQSKVIQVIKK